MTDDAGYIAAFRVGLAGVLVGWLVNGWGFWGVIAAQTVQPVRPPGWPVMTSDTGLILVLWLGVVLLTAAAAALAHRPGLRRVWTHAYAAAVLVFAATYPMAGKAEAYGGLWTAAFWWWAEHQHERDPAALHRHAATLYTWVLAAMFLPPAVGKIMPVWSSGAATELLMRHEVQAEWWQLQTGMPRLTYARAYAGLSAVYEITLGLAPLLPRRPVRWLAVLAIAGMLVTWSWTLLAPLAPLAGLTLAVGRLSRPMPADA